MDGRARINAALYYTEYEDLQTQQFVNDIPGIPPNNLIVNAENGTEAKGLEVDFTFVPVDGLTLFGNYAYSQCEFAGELIIDDFGTDIDGNDCRRTPENAYSFGAQLEGDIGSLGSGYARADYNWSDEFWFDNENLFQNDDEFTLNASVGLLTPDKHWELSVWGKNLTDELNNASVFGLWNTIYANYTPPRTYGATIRWNMD
jgi:iron complex outermembrane receptor protein